MAQRSYRDVSFWFDALAASGRDDLTPRPPLGGDTTADVCIVGGGLTGMWTAYYLHAADPTLRIVVVEQDIAGFGASGRNGGWCSALFPKSAEALAAMSGGDPEAARAGAAALRAAMRGTVDEVGRVAAAEGIDCDYVKGGTVLYARSAVQDRAARAEVAASAAWGDALVHRGPEPGDAAGAVGVVFDPDCARVQPAALARGLARVLEARGVTIAERTPASSWAALPSGGARVVTPRGVVTAGAVVVAVEGYGSQLPQTRRRVLPLYSLMIATEPLPASVWASIGLEHGQTFSDYRHLLVYGQRTADDRFAFGGRGARYHWGSSIRGSHDRVPRVFEHLRRTLGEMFPQIGDAAVTHTWGGPLGVPRDWCASVTWDGSIGTAGGYVGDGLSTTNLAGRTLADLVTGTTSTLTGLPWVDHRSPDWEPEPLRFLGANAGLLATDVADREERLTGRSSVVAKLMAPLTGH